MGFTQRQDEVIDGLSVVPWLFSLVGCLFIVFSCIRFSQLRSPQLLLVACLAGTTFGGDVLNQGANPPTGSTFCYVQGATAAYFDLAVCFFVVVVARCIYQIVVNESSGDQLRSSVRRYILIGFLLPAPFAALPFASKTHGYVNVGSRCWLAPAEPGHPEGGIFRLLLYYAPAWGAVIYASVLYVLIDRRARKLSKQMGGSYTRILKTCEIMYWFPAVTVVTQLPFLIYDFIQFVYNRSDMYRAFLAANFLSLSAGYLYALLYLRTEIVREAWSEHLGVSCCLPKRRGEGPGLMARQASTRADLTKQPSAKVSKGFAGAGGMGGSSRGFQGLTTGGDGAGQGAAEPQTSYQIFVDDPDWSSYSLKKSTVLA